MESKHTHLEMIQGIVNRLSNNSFLLKGWSVVLVSGLFALAAKDAKPLFVYIAYFPCFIFWGLDGYFLWQEKLFRVLYDKVRALDLSSIDYSMNTANVSGSTESWLEVVFSKTLLAFHGTVLVTIIIVMLVLLKTQGG
ncbi:MAG: hypothetical protein HY036_06555 [Nitrospirae bacterium]|nr:hypothetical protein [Nitrospirota bacterium]